MKKSAFWFILATVFVLGCGSTSNSSYSDSHPIQRTNALKMDSFSFIDHNLNRTYITKTIFGENVDSVVKVTIESSGVRNTATGTTEVWAMLRNRTDYDMQVEGMTSFYAEGGMPLDDRSSWKRVYIPANGTALYKESSVSNQAQHFMVEFREGR
jgi:hypothetical protein